MLDRFGWLFNRPSFGAALHASAGLYDTDTVGRPQGKSAVGANDSSRGQRRTGERPQFRRRTKAPKEGAWPELQD
ncbi:MAG: hypothetical protein OXH64_09500 [Rhodospirillaceae bacterium]|nr:hypothetical protein [Rhodospirillaceae bacterium]